MAVGGLLSGFIGGAAEGVDQVAKLSLEERAQKRKEDLQMKLARAKGGSGKGDKNPWEFEVDEIRDDTGTVVDKRRMYVNKETGQRLKAYADDEVNKFAPDLQKLITEYNMSPTEAAQVLKRQYQQKDPDFQWPEGLELYATLRKGWRQGGTRPPVRQNAPTPQVVEEEQGPGFIERISGYAGDLINNTLGGGEIQSPPPTSGTGSPSTSGQMGRRKLYNNR